MKKSLLIGLLMLFCFIGFSQSGTVKRTYYYTFTNVQSSTQIDRAVENIASLKWVKQVKPKYKGGKSGQVIVIVEEPTRTKESQELFSVKSLKQALEAQRLLPVELTQQAEKLR